MNLSVITLNYKKPDLTISCLRSVYHQYKKEFEENKFEFIIVDNNSQDGSIKKISSEIKNNNYRNVKVIINKENSGFGAGNNIGEKESTGQYIVFLNNDTQVKDEGLIKMVKFMDLHHEVGILGGKLKNSDNSNQASAGRFYTPVRVLMLMLGMQRFGILDNSPTETGKVDWVKGALLMIRRDIFEKLNGFDEKIFMYTEDMELCYRAKLDGYNTYFYTDINVIHSEHGSSNRTFAITNIYKNLLYFYKKHRSGSEYFFIRNVLWTKAIVLVIMGRILHNSYLTQTYEKALESIKE